VPTAKPVLFKALASKMSVPTEFTREEVIEFLARIITGGKQSTISREQCLELLLRIAEDRKIDVKDRVDAVRIHSRWLGYQLTEGQIWKVIGVLSTDGQ
jgi:hypothetical protein